MADPIYLSLVESELLGLIGIAVSPEGLRRLEMDLEGEADFLSKNQSYADGKFLYSEEQTARYTDQIRRYLTGQLHVFSLPIDWTVYTPFQTAVLKETLRIPYGKTRSYGEVAASIGNPRASRAVGQAERRNQVPLVIPCHRVIGSDGSLTGYGGKGNTDTKARLLAFEKERAGT
ncbi:MAG: methylated-DNA--[protein]-cysteine S-methyltransferase [Anaerolineales bacterium]